MSVAAPSRRTDQTITTGKDGLDDSETGSSHILLKAGNNYECHFIY